MSFLFILTETGSFVDFFIDFFSFVCYNNNTGLFNIFYIRIMIPNQKFKEA